MTIQHLVGQHEPFDETLRYHVANDWNNLNTENATPKFISPSGDTALQADFTKPVKTATAWQMHINGDLIRFKQVSQAKQDNSGGPGMKRNIGVVDIDIFAETPNRATLFALELERILFGTPPSSSKRLVKSDGVNNSAIATFDALSIDWLETGEFATKGIVHQLAGSIGCVWQRNT